MAAATRDDLVVLLRRLHFDPFVLETITYDRRRAEIMARMDAAMNAEEHAQTSDVATRRRCIDEAHRAFERARDELARIVEPVRCGLSEKPNRMMGS